MKTNGISRLGILGAVVVLLFAVLAVGIGIKLYQSHRPEVEPQVEQQQTKPAQIRPQEEKEIEQSEMTQEDEEFLLWLDEEIEKLEEQEEAKTILVEEEPDDMPEAEPVENEAQEARGFGGWREVWANLDLTEEEQARLKEGVRIAIERWMNMSPQEREAEGARLREMGQRWENMSEEQRQEASERMRDQFEEWRQSGQVELPEISLD